MSSLLTRRQFGALAAAQAPRKPNVIVVAMDSRPSLNASLDRWKEGAVEFTRAYAVSGDPLPSLAAIETGRYPHATGVVSENSVLNPEWRTLGARFSAAGYRTAYLGTWPLGSTSRAVPGYQRQINRIDEMAGSEPYFVFVRSREAPPRLAPQPNTLIWLTALAGGGWQESSIHVPLLIHWPERFGAARQEDWLFASIDTAATLAGLCGLAAMDDTQGVDRSPLLLTGTAERPESVYAQGALGTPEEWRLVVRGWDKLIVDRELQPTHLFNLAVNPQENDNLIKDRGMVRRQEELLALMRRWILTYGDRIPYQAPRSRGEKQ